jgi:predicted hotdog family 3-hydroxylacyl-ACP dehydratase
MLMPSIGTLLPHAGRMRLIDRIVSYDEQRIVCESDSHRAADHPLADDGVLSIICGLEYGAQAMAIHGALLTASSGPTHAGARHGYLVAASDLRWSAERLDRCAAPLTIEANSEFRSDNQVAYRFEIRAADTTLLSGRASVLLHAPVLPIEDPRPQGT